MMDPFRYPRTPRSRSLKPLVFPDLLGKAQDGQNHPQARKRRKVQRTEPSLSSFIVTSSSFCGFDVVFYCRLELESNTRWIHTAFKGERDF